MRRLTFAALAAAALLLAPARRGRRAAAIGIGEQDAAIFRDPLVAAARRARRPLRRGLGRAARALAAREVDALPRRRERRRRARARRLQPLAPPRPSRRKYLPSPAASRREFLRLPQALPVRHDYLTWNEANHRAQPTGTGPEHRRPLLRHPAPQLPRLHDRRAVGARHARHAALGARVRAQRRSHASAIWALHNYIDANRFRTSGTRSLLKAPKAAKIWFTETGGLVAPRQRLDDRVRRLASATRPRRRARSCRSRG